MVQGQRPPEKNNSANYAQQSQQSASMNDELLQTKGKFANDGQEAEDKIILDESSSQQQQMAQASPSNAQATPSVA